jgi:hypothetical protein
VRLTAKEGLTVKKPNEQPPATAARVTDDPLIQEALEMFKGQIKS